MSDKPYYLFFDTETTGLPQSMKIDPIHVHLWPHIAQIAWAEYSQQGILIQERVSIIKPEGYHIPEESTKIHHITHQKAIEEGRPLEAVLRHFMNAVQKATMIICHNAPFDSKVVAAACYRVGLENSLKNSNLYCTMVSTTDLCKVCKTDYGTWKYPKLKELYYFLFRKWPEKEHDALEDVRVTVKCYFKLIRRYNDLTWAKMTT